MLVQVKFRCAEFFRSVCVNATEPTEGRPGAAGDVCFNACLRATNGGYLIPQVLNIRQPAK